MKLIIWRSLLNCSRPINIFAHSRQRWRCGLSESCVWSHVSHVWSCVWSHVSYVWSHVSCVWSHVSYVWSCVWSHVSCVWSHVSYVWSCVWSHVSYVWRCVLCAVCIFLGPQLLAMVRAVPCVMYVACMLRVCCVCCHRWKILKSHCNTLQHTATHCNTLQHTATHCNTLQHNATQNFYLHFLATVRVVQCVVWVPFLMRVALCHLCVVPCVMCVVPCVICVVPCVMCVVRVSRVSYFIYWSMYIVKVRSLSSDV